jgi:hypothetical protein
LTGCKPVSFSRRTLLHGVSCFILQPPSKPQKPSQCPFGTMVGGVEWWGFRQRTLPLLWAGSSVGIATGYGLWYGDRIPVGARFSAPVQTGPGAHPASCTMGTGPFPGVESVRGVTLTTHPLLVPRSKNKVALCHYSP